jgi:hypothetical protein
LKIFRAVEYSDTIIAYGGYGESACAALEAYAVGFLFESIQLQMCFCLTGLETKGVYEFHERLILYKMLLFFRFLGKIKVLKTLLV